jgi:NAD(P)-dependent dehydrogenase (short-subunit alcohol dehydrogenase family)
MTGWTLITGAGVRLGRAVALAAGGAGHSVVVHYRTSAKGADEIVRALPPGRAVTIGADLADPAAAEDLIQRAAQAAGGPITQLVNCAAIFEHDTLDTFSADALARHAAVNTTAPVLLMKALAAALPDGETGAVVNFLDFKLAQPYPDHFAYTLSKYALAGATDLAARALAPRIRVNAVAPGYMLPAPDQSREDFERLHARTPLRRGAEPDDIADAVLFLLRNPSVTGQTIFVDAGLRFLSRERDLSFS